ncbi:MAG: aminotransferase class V-fold PLP-dependent enzyme [Alphaproteobacteria bacterium]|nr:aminotransferase class V-fold PLP-dependent enzyme [Alphaproteobacteria bacterium]
MTISDNSELMAAIRDRFAHVDSCPFQGPRVFFENAGGALTLKSVVETSTRFAAMPDNPGRANPAGRALVDLIGRAKEDVRLFFNAPDGDVFVGESGTELIFRLISSAILGAAEGGIVLGSSLEHPATRSACNRWAEIAGKPYVCLPHDDATGTVTAEHYRAHLTPDVRVATILHTSPVTGMGVDLAGIATAIREVAPDAFIIVDGIQHASHGQIDIAGYGIDGYVISPYKVFSRHGYGIAWTSPRLNALPHNALMNGPEGNWELGTRDAGSYATMSDVVGYFRWLGQQVSDSDDPREQIEAAGRAIHAHEKRLTDVMLNGKDNLRGLAEIPGVKILGGVENPAREGLVSFALDSWDSEDLVAALNAQGIRTHVRKADHYSGNILDPLGMPACVRVSMCHYNTEQEVAQFLSVMSQLVGEKAA